MENFSTELWRQVGGILLPGRKLNIGSNRWSLEWSFEEFVGQGRITPFTCPLLTEWHSDQQGETAKSYARIVVKTTFLVSFLTVPQNEKQSDSHGRFPSKEQDNESESA